MPRIGYHEVEAAPIAAPYQPEPTDEIAPA